MATIETYIYVFAIILMHIIELVFFYFHNINL